MRDQRVCRLREYETSLSPSSPPHIPANFPAHFAATVRANLQRGSEGECRQWVRGGMERSDLGSEATKEEGFSLRRRQLGCRAFPTDECARPGDMRIDGVSASAG